MLGLKFSAKFTGNLIVKLIEMITFEFFKEFSAIYNSILFRESQFLPKESQSQGRRVIKSDLHNINDCRLSCSRIYFLDLFSNLDNQIVAKQTRFYFDIVVIRKARLKILE